MNTHQATFDSLLIEDFSGNLKQFSSFTCLCCSVEPSPSYLLVPVCLLFAPAGLAGPVGGKYTVKCNIKAHVLIDKTGERSWTSCCCFPPGIDHLFLLN